MPFYLTGTLTIRSIKFNSKVPEINRDPNKRSNFLIRAEICPTLNNCQERTNKKYVSSYTPPTRVTLVLGGMHVVTVDDGQSRLCHR